MQIWNFARTKPNNPAVLAEELSKKYSIEVISAEDDMILEL